MEGEAVGIMGVTEGDIVVKRKDKRGESGSGWLSRRKSKGWRKDNQRGQLIKEARNPEP